MSEHKQMVMQVLEAVYPFQTDFLGTPTIEDIIDGANFENTQLSSNLDMTVALATIATGVVTIKGILDVYFLLKEAFKRKPLASEVESTAKEKGISTTLESGTELHNLVVIVFKTLDL